MMMIIIIMMIVVVVVVVVVMMMMMMMMIIIIIIICLMCWYNLVYITFSRMIENDVSKHSLQRSYKSSSSIWSIIQHYFSILLLSVYTLCMYCYKESVAGTQTSRPVFAVISSHT